MRVKVVNLVIYLRIKINLNFPNSSYITMPRVENLLFFSFKVSQSKVLFVFLRRTRNMTEWRTHSMTKLSDYSPTYFHFIHMVGLLSLLQFSFASNIVIFRFKNAYDTSINLKIEILRLFRGRQRWTLLSFYIYGWTSVPFVILFWW